MKKKNVLFGVIFIVFVIIGYLFQSGAFLSDEQKEEKLKTEQINKINKTKFAKLPRITFDELEQKINNNDDFVVYFGWVENCGDSRLFQMNTFDKYLSDEKIKSKVFVVDLDKEAPDALVKKDLRTPISKRFQIDKWTKDETLSPMELKGPQLIHYKDGKIEDLVSWTVLNGDSEYGIKDELTQIFFDKLK